MANLTVPIIIDWKDIEKHMVEHDFVKVVRCENCRYHKGGCAYVYQRIVPVPLDHFCGYGKPKE